MKTNKVVGKFLTNDKQSSEVLLEWCKTTLFAPEFAGLMKEAWELARIAYTPVEMQFLHKFPQVVGSEPYFTQFEPLFKNGIQEVDWHKAEEIMQSLLKSHFIIDASLIPDAVKEPFAKDVIYVVVVREPATKKMLGFITFMERVSYAPGEVKVMSFAVDPMHQHRGLGKLLMSSIITIKPTIKRISLCTRVTNEVALRAYSAWGFLTDEHPIMDHPFNLAHWVFLDYRLDKNKTLQIAAAKLKAA